MSGGGRMPRGWWLLIIGFPLLTLVLVIGGVLIAAQGGFASLSVPKDGEGHPPVNAATLAHGEYLARIGGCLTCHTARGGEPLAGGRGFASEWGVLYSSNLTPDPEYGIGNWTAAEFRHAMKHGVSRHGFLYPGFPFQNFQHVDDDDLDAIFAWLHSQPPVAAEGKENRLESPASWRTAMLGWRMLFHRPQPFPDNDPHDDEWRRGRYLVEGLGHCSMCHGSRGAYESIPLPLRLAGGRITGQGWVAPPLDGEALARWNIDDLANYLRVGVASQGGAYGPMAEVIQSGLQYLSVEDARAMARYLLGLPPAPRLARGPRFAAIRASEHVDAHTTALYEQHCAGCHGAQGEGDGHDYPPLAGNPRVLASDPVNLIRVTLYGAAAPSTRGNPAPHTMPPFIHQLSDADLLALLNHVRGSWGNEAPEITRTRLDAVRGMALEQ